MCFQKIEKLVNVSEKLRKDVNLWKEFNQNQTCIGHFTGMYIFFRMELEVYVFFT